MKKKAKHRPQPCPCGQPATLDACCGPCIEGRSIAPTAEALMRSRYTAYTQRNTDYLLDTWHASTRPPSLETRDNPRWLGRTITQAASTGADTAIVEFIARYRSGGRAHRLHEVSRFVREDGRWRYVGGDILED